MRRTIMLLVLVLGWLAGCGAPAEPEPSADSAESIPATPAAGALAPVTPAATPTPVEERTAMPADAADMPDDTPEDTAPADEPVTSVSGAPVVVDLSKLTPAAPADTTPRVMPAPGVPVRVPPDKQTLVDAMRADLLTRFKVDPDRVRVIYFQAVTWPSGALGCPQPGISYTMALVDGYQVIFVDADGREYYYHSAGDAQFIYCANGQRFVGGDS